jgi:hypothetical protein
MHVLFKKKSSFLSINTSKDSTQSDGWSGNSSLAYMSRSLVDTK